MRGLLEGFGKRLTNRGKSGKVRIVGNWKWRKRSNLSGREEGNGAKE